MVELFQVFQLEQLCTFSIFYSLMIWPGRPNHDIEGWDLFSKNPVSQLGIRAFFSILYFNLNLSTLNTKPISKKKKKKESIRSFLLAALQASRIALSPLTISVHQLSHRYACDADAAFPISYSLIRYFLIHFFSMISNSCTIPFFPRSVQTQTRRAILS